MSSFESGFPVSICVSIKKAAVVLAATLSVLLMCVPLFSQGSYGRILGSVLDQTGGAIAGATITVTDVDRGVSRTLTADDAGQYNAPNLLPGKYTVRAEAKGFKTVERQNVILEVGKEPRVDLTMQPGEQTQTLTVTEAIPLVEATNATMGGTLNNADIGDLPLNGRDYQNLLALRPGVQLYPGGGPWTQSANGTRPDESVWMVDGVINVNPFDARPVANMPSPFTDAATILPIDAIQEFNLMENPKAEYGWKPGAVVNVGIKSGTNTLHGSAYAFGRTSDWDARNYFNVTPSSDGTCALSSTFPAFCNKNPVELKQFGATVGGPIKKDKLFFFGGYEGLRDSISVPFSIPVPATASIGDPSKSMVDAINAVGAANISTVSEKLLCPNAVGQPLPLPASFVCTGGFTPQTGTSFNYLSTFPIINQSDNGIGKIDYHLNDKNQIFGTLFVGFYNALGEDRPFTNAAFEDNSPIRTWSNVESWVYTPNSTWVNELRFGYDRVSFNFTNVDINIPADGKGYPINTGITVPGGMPTVNVFGFANAGAQMLGTNFNRPQFNSPNPYFDVQDAVSYLKGKHAFKFGFEFAHLEGDIATYSDGRGFFNFLGGGVPGLACPATGSASSCPLEDFFAGKPSNAIRLVGDPHRTATWVIPAGFVQDDWRVTTKLIINLGLRYEYVQPMNMKNNAWATFDPALGLVQQGASSRPTLWNGDHNGVQPRLGFAYDVTGKGTTVIRGGGSLIHTSWPLFTFLGAFGLQNDNSTSPAAVPTAATLQCSAGFGGEAVCPSTPGGNNALGTATIAGSALNWNAPAGGPGVFPSVGISCGDGIGANASPCDVMGINKDLRNPFVFNYNLSVQHQIGSNLSVEVAYVGNHGYRLLNFADANQSPLGAGWCLNSLTAAQLTDACSGLPSGTPLSAYNPQAAQEGRPFFTKYPYLGFINQITNRSHSNYNSMQVTITKRMSQGLSFTTGYTYAHGLDNGSLNRFGLQPQDSNNPEFEYGASDFDIRHRLTVTATYNIPGRKGFGQLLEGWQLNTIVSYQTPEPWIAFDPGDNISGTGENVDRWNIFGNALDFPSGKEGFPYCTGFTYDPGTGKYGTGGVSCNVVNPYGSQTFAATASELNGCVSRASTPPAGSSPTLATLASFGCYISTNGQSFIVPPALGSFGNMGRNIFRDSGFRDWDLSIFKNFKFRERFGAQLRWELFNILNQPQIVNPYGSSSAINAGNSFGAGNLGAPGLTPDVGAGNPLIGSGSERVMQVGLKLTF